jgi:hypothetical protein
LGFTGIDNGLLERMASLFTTIKQVTEAGYRERKEWEYDGKQITIKGRMLVCNPKEAISETAWSKLGFRVRYGVMPHCRRTVRIEGQGRRIYDVYREDQVEPKRQIVLVPPKAIDLLAALWAINRRAKRCRDGASRHFKSHTHAFAAALKREKGKLYWLKGQALHYLLAEGQLEIVGHHRFPDGNWAEVLRGSGYTFHRPCADQAASTAEEINEIEAKPRGSKEPRLKDALHTVEEFLREKPEVRVFEWARRTPALSRRSARYGGEDDLDNFDDDYENSDW